MSNREPLPPPLRVLSAPDLLLGQVFGPPRLLRVELRRIRSPAPDMVRIAQVLRLRAEHRTVAEDAPLHARLSTRELQVFVRIARGVSPAVMADELGLSVKTISTYRARILEKTGLRSNVAIAVAWTLGIVDGAQS